MIAVCRHSLPFTMTIVVTDIASDIAVLARTFQGTAMRGGFKERQEGRSLSDESARGKGNRAQYVMAVTRKQIEPDMNQNRMGERVDDALRAITRMAPQHQSEDFLRRLSGFESLVSPLIPANNFKI